MKITLNHVDISTRIQVSQEIRTTSNQGRCSYLGFYLSLKKKKPTKQNHH